MLLLRFLTCRIVTTTRNGKTMKQRKMFDTCVYICSMFRLTFRPVSVRRGFPVWCSGAGRIREWGAERRNINLLHHCRTSRVYFERRTSWRYFPLAIQGRWDWLWCLLDFQAVCLQHTIIDEVSKMPSMNLSNLNIL
jgi:hypothetical protein